MKKALTTIVFSFFLIIFNAKLASGYTYSDVYGTNNNDTIVYGNLVAHGVYYDVDREDWYPYTANAGPGICVFSKSVIYPFRGAFQHVDLWDDYPDADYYRIYADVSDNVNSSDLVYPADKYDNDEIYCGGSCGFFCYYYIQVDSYESPQCDLDDCELPSDFRVVIYGDRSRTSGYGGSDIIWGWDNQDTLFGCYGDDDIYGEGGRDYIYGDDGDDDLSQGGYYGAYAHYMYGGDGDDTLNGSEGIDFLYGGNDSDELFGNGGNDYMWGDSGLSDDCYGGADTNYCQLSSCETRVDCINF